MKSNATSLALVSDGTIKMDGGQVFGQVPKVIWEGFAPPDRRNRVNLGLNCLVVKNGDSCVLIDTGVGTKEPEQLKERFGVSRSGLLKNLRNMGISPREITHVVLTHLHDDHSGGSTRLDRSGEAVPTFPSATYFIQREAWEEAVHPNERASQSYIRNDFMPLKERNQICLLDGPAEVAPGVRVKVTGGHCKGHQMVVINHGGERVAFMGDLVPTHHHLRVGCIPSLDVFPEETLETKRELLDEAERHGWLMVFPHGLDTRAGYLERRMGDLNFRPVDF